jgi:hypothetical protein
LLIGFPSRTSAIIRERVVEGIRPAFFAQVEFDQCAVYSSGVDKEDNLLRTVRVAVEIDLQLTELVLCYLVDRVFEVALPIPFSPAVINIVGRTSLTKIPNVYILLL